MTTISQKPTLATGNITSIVGMTLGIVPLAGLIVSVLGLVRSIRERTHPGFAVIGVGLGLFSTVLFVALSVGIGFLLGSNGIGPTDTITPEQFRQMFGS